MIRFFTCFLIVGLGCVALYMLSQRPSSLPRPMGNTLVRQEAATEKKLVPWTINSFYSNDTLLDRLTDSIYNSLSDKEKVAQLIMPGTSSRKNIGLPFSEIKRLYNNRQIGGVVFLKGNKIEFASQISELNKTSKSNKALPLIFSCDCEPALFHKKFMDADSLTTTSSLKTSEQVRKVVDDIASQIKTMGIHWNLAPVVDLSTNKEIIDNRSFGSDNKHVVSQSIAFISQSSQQNIATTVKHFPGHGSVKGDSHHKLVYADSSLPELSNFKAVIEAASPASVMLGHIAIPKNSRYNTKGLPASISKEVVTGLLRENLEFNGIIITDAMNMAAVKNFRDADFKAIQAGNDMVLMPLNVVALHTRLLGELKRNSLLKEQLVASIKKVIRLKICVGAIRL